MVDVSGLMQRLCNSEDDDIGMVNHVEDQRWIVGDHDLFPIHVEELVNGQGVLLYATILRETSEPVYLPLISTLFIEGISGHSLGRYGICPGPISLSLYLKVDLNETDELEKLKSKIACHRLLVECFLETEMTNPEAFDPVSTESGLEHPMVPLRH